MGQKGIEPLFLGAEPSVFTIGLLSHFLGIDNIYSFNNLLHAE